MELSIIIPSYNAKESICDTLDSIERQIIPFSYEVILVNDCSDYDYEDIVLKYKDKFLIREIKTNNNVGPGGSRQYGIDNSESNYIVFIDSDDLFVGEDSLFKMYNEIKVKEADLLIGNFIYRRDKKEIIKKNNLVWLHGKMYKRQFLEKYSIRFNNSRANEDNGFNRLILLLNPKIVFLDEEVYIYNENPNSITRKDNRAYRFYGIEGFCFNMNWAMDEAIKRGVSKNIIAVLATDVLATLYIYYIGLQEEYDVSKILEWGKEINNKYKLYSNLLTSDYYLSILKEKKEFLKDDFLIDNYTISFEEFLKIVH